MVADDLSAYKPVVERLGIEHQICVARVKKWARNRLDRIEGWAWGKARIWRLLTELLFGGDLELPRLERMVRDGGATLRRPRVELSEKWRALLRHRRRRDVSWTNNVTERAIGRSKIRYKTVRGDKSEDGMLNTGLGLGGGLGAGGTPRYESAAMSPRRRSASKRRKRHSATATAMGASRNKTAAGIAFAIQSANAAISSAYDSAIADAAAAASRRTARAASAKPTAENTTADTPKTHVKDSSAPTPGSRSL